MSLSTLAGFAGPLDELLLWLGGKTSLSDVPPTPPQVTWPSARRASAIAGRQFARVCVARRRIAQVCGSQ